MNEALDDEEDKARGEEKEGLERHRWARRHEEDHPDGMATHSLPPQTTRLIAQPHRGACCFLTSILCILSGSNQTDCEGDGAHLSVGAVGEVRRIACVWAHANVCGETGPNKARVLTCLDAAP